VGTGQIITRLDSRVCPSGSRPNNPQQLSFPESAGFFTGVKFLYTFSETVSGAALQAIIGNM